MNAIVYLQQHTPKNYELLTKCVLSFTITLQYIYIHTYNNKNALRFDIELDLSLRSGNIRSSMSRVCTAHMLLYPLRGNRKPAGAGLAATRSVTLLEPTKPFFFLSLLIFIVFGFVFVFISVLFFVTGTASEAFPTKVVWVVPYVVCRE